LEERFFFLDDTRKNITSTPPHTQATGTGTGTGRAATHPTHTGRRIASLISDLRVSDELYPIILLDIYRNRVITGKE
jgi:hypothetical protein